jgi:hypothetical protein
MGWRVFYSYSHKNADLRDRLGIYLAPLKHQKKIVEWHDRKIEPGSNWETEISTQLEVAHLIVFLLSADFLASEYCFGVEVEKAFTRLKLGQVKVVPILLKPCLWEESRFSGLQIIPRDAKAITSWASPEEAFKDVAKEISSMVNEAPPLPSEPSSERGEGHRFDSSLDLVRGQVRSYAHLYEKTRQRMRPSNERTDRMEQIFEKMRALATASYPLLDELANSPSPGDRLAAVAILQVFATEKFFPFLLGLIGSEKPFVGYHATRALHFAVGSLDPHVYPQLLETIQNAQTALKTASVGFDSGGQTVLRAAEQELHATIESLAVPPAGYD